MQNTSEQQKNELCNKMKDSRLTRSLFFAGVLVVIKLGNVLFPEYKGLTDIVGLFGGIGLYGIIATLVADRRTKRDIFILILLEIVCIVHIAAYLWYFTR